MSGFYYRKSALLICATALGAVPCVAARPKQSNICKVYFTVVEHDEQTSNLNMVGLTAPQKSWWEKHGPKDSPGLCFISGNASGERVTTESADETYIEKTVGSAPLYSISWEEHRLFVPDDNGGHYAWSAQGIISIYDATADNGKGDLVAVAPVHNTNRTILSSSGASLLKDAIGEISRRASATLAGP